MNSRLFCASTDMLLHTFEVPVLGLRSGGMVSSFQLSFPVCASIAKTEPGGCTACVQSCPDQPTKSWFLKTVGGCRMESGHFALTVFHWLMSRTPFCAKPVHACPLSASTAYTLPSIVPR